MNITKQALHLHCLQLVNDRIAHLKAASAELKEALSSEESNSAGDKHETGRSMIDLEQEQISGQLKQTLDVRDTLERLTPRVKPENIVPGTLVETDAGIYYIAVGLGKVTFEDTLVFVVSAEAPIGAAMLGHKPGESFNFNNRVFNIKSIR